jgi:hypothetical protein
LSAKLFKLLPLKNKEKSSKGIFSRRFDKSSVVETELNRSSAHMHFITFLTKKEVLFRSPYSVRDNSIVPA